MEELRVFVVGEDPYSRQGLASAVGALPGIRVVGQAGLDDRLEGALRLLRPEAGLWDAATGRMGPEPLRASLPERPPWVAILSGDAQALEALAAGARGILLRLADVEEIAAALRAAARGLFVFDETLAASLLRARPRESDDVPVEALTSRELEVLQLLAEGFSNRQIAERLRIAESTAKFHVNAILGKLSAANRTEALVRAARLGLVLL